MRLVVDPCSFTKLELHIKENGRDFYCKECADDYSRREVK